MYPEIKTAAGSYDCPTPSGLERTHFYPRQLVTPADLTQDQIYFREKMRRHNRFMHGWGVVCGALVKPGSSNCELVVSPGYILGPYGDEISIEAETSVDICKEDADGNLSAGCGEETDPWCRNVRQERRSGQTYYLAVRYEECRARPVRVHPAGCGCDGDACEYSRIRDGFVLKLLPGLPKSYNKSGRVLLDEALSCGERGRTRPCLPCPSEPWVILADVVFQGDRGVEIDCYAHRRFVAAFGGYSFGCEPKGYGEVIDTGRWKEIVLKLEEDVSAGVLAGYKDEADLNTLYEKSATALKGVRADSVLERQLTANELSIAGLAEMLPERLAELARAGDSNAKRAAERAKQALDLQDRARRVLAALKET